MFIDQLRKQLGFIQRSCDSFDAGFTDEAMRIAVSIRVLLHDTRNSTSLLTHIDAKNISIRTTCPLIDMNTIMFCGGLSSAQIQIQDGKLPESSYEPIFDSLEQTKTYIDVDSWWNQIIYRIKEGDVKRKHIVLGAANKDGGAHVDPKLTAEYQALCTGVMTIGHSSAFESYEFQLPNSHLADLRQMGHEVLTSPDLRSLVGNK